VEEWKLNSLGVWEINKVRQTIKHPSRSKHSSKLDSASGMTGSHSKESRNSTGFDNEVDNLSSESHKAMESGSTDIAEPSASKSALVPLSRMVRIVWTDSCSRSGWTTPGAAREWSTAVLTVQSVGFIFSDEPDSMVLAQSFDSNQDPNPNGMLQIPRSAILSIREVNANAGVHS
jgi:hypothetical protein